MLRCSRCGKNWSIPQAEARSYLCLDHCGGSIDRIAAVDTPTIIVDEPSAPAASGPPGTPAATPAVAAPNPFAETIDQPPPGGRDRPPRDEPPPVRPTAPPAVDVASLVTDLPLPIAMPATRYLSESAARLLVHRACDVIESITRFSALILLSDVVRLNRSLPMGLANAIGSRLEQPRPGAWAEILRDVQTALGGQIDLSFSRGGAFIPDLVRFAQDTLLPALGDPSGDPAKHLLALRSLASTGPALTDDQATALLSEHRSRIDSVIGRLTFFDGYTLVGVDEKGTARRLHGAPGPGGTFPSFDLESSLRHEGVPQKALLVRVVGTRQLSLDVSPRALFEALRSRGPDANSRAPLTAHFSDLRSEWLDFGAPTETLLSGDSVDRALVRFVERHQLEDWALAAARAGEARAFEFGDRITELAEPFLGRTDQVRRALDWLKAAREGVAWITGPAGIGKSAFLAALVRGLSSMPSVASRIVHFFRRGDARSNRQAFLRSAIAKLTAALGPDSPAATSAGPAESRFFELIERVSRLAPATGTPPRRVIFVLDGLDDVVADDPSFPELVFRARRPGVVFVCSGRGEHGLAKAFSRDRTTWLFADEPGGSIPPLDEANVLGVVRREIRRATTLVAGKDDASVQETVKAIGRQIAGHPLHLRLVQSALRDNLLTLGPDGEPTLPPAALEYWSDLLATARVSDTGVALTRVLCLLAMSHAPMTVGLVVELVGGESPFDGGDVLDLMGEVLDDGRAFLRWAPTQRGELGLALAHPALRACLREGSRVRRTAHWARQRFFSLVALLGRESEGSPVHDYALLHGLEHLIEEGAGTEVAELLTSPTYLTEKARRVGVASLGLDFQKALESPALAGMAETKKIRALSRAFERRIAILRAEPERIAAELGRDILAKETGDPQIHQMADRLALHGAASSRGPVVVVRVKPKPFMTAEEMFGLIESGNWITAMASSLDGRYLAVATGRQFVSIWDSSERREVSRISGHSDLVNCAAFSRDGALVVTGSVDQTARVWDTQSGQHLATLKGHTDEVTAVGITAQGRALTASWDGTFRFWDVQTGQEVQRFAGGNRLANCLIESLDGKRLVSGCWEEKAVKLWDAAGGQHLATFTGHTDRVTTVAASPDGAWIASGSADHRLIVWSVAAVTSIANIDVGAPIVTCRFALDGRSIHVIDDGTPGRQPRQSVLDILVPAKG